MNNSLYKLLKNHGLSDEDICSIESLNPTIYELDDLLNWLESGHSFKEHPFDYCNQFKGQFNYIEASKLYYQEYFEEDNKEWITILQER
ncbi:MAG: hypothetical protein SOU19_09240 [Candidatus Caccosoma sp.]|nr:hypothetical protein [Candidatus Caccosoma sp.]